VTYFSFSLAASEFADVLSPHEAKMIVNNVTNVNIVLLMIVGLSKNVCKCKIKFVQWE